MDNDVYINPKYAPLFDPATPCRYFIVSGSRASGKSFCISTYLCNHTTTNRPSKILFTRYTMTAAHISIIPEFSQKIELLGMESSFDIQVKDIYNVETGNSILFRGIKTSSGNQTANLKSIQGIDIWCNDESEELVDEDVFDTIDLSIREKNAQNRVILVLNPSDTNHWIYKRFFADTGVNYDFCGIKDDVCYIHSTYLDNLENLSDSFLEQAERVKKVNVDKYNHLFLGTWIKENELALWKRRTMIDPYRVQVAPELKRICVGVDPAVTSTGNQDETGIIVAGQGFDDEYYVIDDASALFTTAEWGKAVIGVYIGSKADRIIAEVNQGGDLVEMNITNSDSTGQIKNKVKKVHATRGKVKRAEPISALYEDGKVHHVGQFKELEDEMCSYTGSKNDDSPNRLDALVWVLHHLSQNEDAMPSIMQL